MIIRKRHIPMIIWGILVAMLANHLWSSLINTNNPTLEFEAYIFYVGILMLLSFPLGTIGLFLCFIVFSFIPLNLPHNVSNILDATLATVIATAAFYYQWYILFPKLKRKFLKRKKLQ